MSAPDANGWMPISTAPRDETDILLIRVFGSAIYPPSVAAWFDDGWYSHEFPDDRMDGQFTHWQPIPKPPVQP